jgi:Tfp pilus assembly protein PilO
MKVKILLMPLVIAISMGLCIWLVYPAYSNGVSGVKEKYEQLKKEDGKLAEMKEKNANVEKLFSEISSLSLEKEILYKFIPEDIREDVIVNSIGRIASEFNLIVNEISIKSSPKRTEVATAGEIEGGSKLPSSKESRVTIKLLGRYEEIKGFLEKIYKADRYSNLKLMQIDNNLEEEKNNLATLVANVEIDYSVLERTRISDGNKDDAVFSSSSLDKSIIDLIKNQKNATNNDINVEQKGKVNLFTP